MKNEDIDELFAYHAPKVQADKDQHQSVRATLALATKDIAQNLPYSRERALFITSMQQAAMWANAALALHRDDPPAMNGEQVPPPW